MAGSGVRKDPVSEGNAIIREIMSLRAYFGPGTTLPWVLILCYELFCFSSIFPTFIARVYLYLANNKTIWHQRFYDLHGKMVEAARPVSLSRIGSHVWISPLILPALFHNVTHVFIVLVALRCTISVHV